MTRDAPIRPFGEHLEFAAGFTDSPGPSPINRWERPLDEKTARHTIRSVLKWLQRQAVKLSEIEEEARAKAKEQSLKNKVVNTAWAISDGVDQALVAVLMPYSTALRVMGGHEKWKIHFRPGIYLRCWDRMVICDFVCATHVAASKSNVNNSSPKPQSSGPASAGGFGGIKSSVSQAFGTLGHDVGRVVKPIWSASEPVRDVGKSLIDPAQQIFAGVVDGYVPGLGTGVGNLANTALHGEDGNFHTGLKKELKEHVDRFSEAQTEFDRGNHLAGFACIDSASGGRLESANDMTVSLYLCKDKNTYQHAMNWITTQVKNQFDGAGMYKWAYGVELPEKANAYQIEGLIRTCMKDLAQGTGAFVGGHNAVVKYNPNIADTMEFVSGKGAKLGNLKK